MKKFSWILIPFLLASCTKTLYTHRDYLSQFRTKTEVINSFGLPVSKLQEGEYTQFVYDYGRTAVGIGTSNVRNQTDITFNRNSINSTSNTNGLYFGQVHEYSKYLSFTFDKYDNVINYASRGVDFGKKKNNTFGTIGIVILSLGAAVGLGLALASGPY